MTNTEENGSTAEEFVLCDKETWSRVLPPKVKDLTDKLDGSEVTNINFKEMIDGLRDMNDMERVIFIMCQVVQR